MDEKELIKRVKNSFKAKKSQAEILTGFQKRGYKLAYANEIIKKANRPKRIAITLLITTLLFFSLTFSAYTLFSNNQKLQISNPLSQFTITGNTITSVSNQSMTIPPEEIKITPDLITFFLNEIGAWQLHKNPFTLEKPIINFQIGTKTFNSEIDSEIKTTEGLIKDADLQFNIDKQDIINAILDDNPEEILKQSVTSGRTQIELKASNVELASKGYLKLYETLN